nr:class I SAM-dependent methyltransferase [Actinomycetota bacterium]
IDTARANAEASGVSDRVTFHTVDAGAADGLGADGGYDVVIALECIHDLSDPVGVLGTMRRLAGDKGVVLVMDEAVGHEFTGEDDVVERLMYGFSLVCCLPDGRSHTPSVATGTVMRPATLERYAVEAGFSGVDELPIDADLFRFYQLR